tara:strand:+ start:5639 stop:6184 length:546 start_codon:yes stop_codon:yes gene_type:complete
MNFDKDRWEGAAQSFESSLMILRKDKNGWVIGFSVHPNDAPTDLLDAPLGTRFRAVLFQIDDDEQPLIKEGGRESTTETDHSQSLDPLIAFRQVDLFVAKAGKVCRNPEFQSYMIGQEYAESLDEKLRVKETRDSLCAAMGVQSRAELRTNEEARVRFSEVMREFNSIGMSKVGLDTESLT